MLAVVEDEQQRARCEELDHRVDDVLPRQRAHVERRRDRVRHELRLGDRGELDERRRRPRTHASPPRASSSASLVLPAPPVPGERQQPRAPEQRAQLAELAAAADERARIGRQRAGRAPALEPAQLRVELGGELGELLARSSSAQSS